MRDYELLTELGNWLAKCRCHAVVLGYVQMFDKLYPAARYKQTRTWPAGNREYVQEAIYIVGEAPKEYLKPGKKGKPCFRFLGDLRDWYVASYTRPDQVLSPEYLEFHPFGHNFLLMPWEAPGSIDDGEKKPYVRHPVTFTVREED